MAMRRQARVLALPGALLVALALALATSGCASDDEGAVETAPTVEAKPAVELLDRSEVTGNKAFHFTASTPAKLSGAGGRFAIYLRGVDLQRATKATFQGPNHVDTSPCVVEPCEWTILPVAAATYEFRAFAVNLDSRKAVAQSSPVRAVWTAQPRPFAFEFLVNGKSMPTTALNGGDKYFDVPVGRLQIDARWTTDTRDTGYYVVIAMSAPREHIYATCRVGTFCAVPTKVPTVVGQETTWQVRLMTTQGDKLVDGVQVCLIARA